ncbi:unnamed protein product [Calypogeia fissa]
MCGNYQEFQVSRAWKIGIDRRSKRARTQVILNLITVCTNTAITWPNASHVLYCLYFCTGKTSRQHVRSGYFVSWRVIWNDACFYGHGVIRQVREAIRGVQIVHNCQNKFLEKLKIDRYCLKFQYIRGLAYI